jgi:Tfp pilus assembly protein PilF
MNLMIGLPQQSGNQAKVALRNMGEIDVIVDLVATTADGQELVIETTIKAKSFGEATFKTTKKIVRIEVDKDKLYPQTDYQDDIAPREIGENDALVFIKREFDRQRFDDAEKNAEAVLKVYPIFDDARILLARAQLAQNKTSAAKTNFEEVLKLTLPSAQSIAWANVGLGEIAQKAGKNSEAREFYTQAIKTDSDLGATLTARRGRLKTGTSTENQDPAVKAFFEAFDKAVAANNKSEIDSLILNGEIARFASSVAGQAQAWQTDILHIDKIDDNNMLIEVNMSVKLLNRENETGLAVYRLSRGGNGWKLSDVEIFEVS